MDEKKIELGLSQALQKYGDKVYSLFICNLQDEFGSEVFPSWISVFRDAPDDPRPEQKLGTPLWEITESFCYPPDSVCASRENGGYNLTDDEQRYFSIFRRVLMYKN